MDIQGINAESRTSVAEAAFPWFALRVKSNFEEVSSLHLRQRGFVEYSPSYSVNSRWTDRVKLIRRPLFPGYVFCRMNPNDRLPVISAPGVLNALGFGKTPSPIPDEEISAIQAILASGQKVKPWPFLHVGQRVIIERGSLKGVEGILVRFKNACRIVVSINLLQRSVSAEVDEDAVRSLPRSDHRGPVRSTVGISISTRINLGRVG